MATSQVLDLLIPGQGVVRRCGSFFTQLSTALFGGDVDIVGRYGMIVDVSHAGERTSLEAIERAASLSFHPIREH